jgi:hypothetical protein
LVAQMKKDDEAALTSSRRHRVADQSRFVDQFRFAYWLPPISGNVPPSRGFLSFHGG